MIIYQNFFHCLPESLDPALLRLILLDKPIDTIEIGLELRKAMPV